MEKIKLAHPVEIKGSNGTTSQITELSLERLKVKHLKLIPKDLFTSDDKTKINPVDFIPLIAGLANVSEDIIAELDVQEDLVQIIQRLESFFEVSRGTGTN